eukprot:2098097-Prymnesium_polylepis.3
MGLGWQVVQLKQEADAAEASGSVPRCTWHRTGRGKQVVRDLEASRTEEAPPVAGSPPLAQMSP